MNTSICLSSYRPQDTTAGLCSLSSDRQLLGKEADEFMDFFCEDGETVRLDECFAVLHGFCLKFSHAVKVGCRIDGSVEGSGQVHLSFEVKA